MSLRLERDRLRVARQDPPWKVVRAFSVPGAGALVHLHNVSGGVLAGDRLSLDVEVADGASTQITTTGATRLYRHRAGAADSEQRNTFTVGAGGLLEYLPDAVIPYAGSRHAQCTEVRLGTGAALLWWEVVAPGRLAAGERFAFERLRLENKVYAGPRLVVRENALLEPGRADLASPARMLEYSHTASLWALQEGRQEAFWRALEDRLNRRAEELTRRGEALWGASTLISDGIVVRGLGGSARFLHEPLTEFWRTVRVAILGQDAAPPRKTY
ncbi:MAG TPA: urease accessory protein UreD [Bryobacteraceae bacterium]|nr:urease accessory protein UreD [Bryobacteraceae bacterium]